jgi:hypothetical protein
MSRVLAPLPLIALAAAAACSSGTLPVLAPNPALNRQETRIIGGRVDNNLPAVGSIGNCTATLIGPRTVLTAGHCVVGRVAADVQFVIGVDVSAPDYVLQASTLTVNPAFDPKLDNDVAVITLAADAPVQPMPLISGIDATWVGRQLTFLGYGVTDGAARTGAGVKRTADLTITGVQPTTLTYGGTGDNTCFGDSGGPSFYQDEHGALWLVGVTSYTTSKDCSTTSGATRVDAYRSFITTYSAATVAADACGGETFAGRCNGDTVIWCNNNQVHTQDCASVGAHCGFSALDQFNACLPGPAPAATTDPCAGETYQGRCDGNTAIWCYANKAVMRDDCAANGEVCRWNADTGYYDCLPPPN